MLAVKFLIPIVTITFFSLLSFFGVKAQPLVSVKYPEPPDNSGSATSTIGGGGRGPCGIEKNEEILILSLIPQDEIITTASERPSLFWYVPDNQIITSWFTLLSEEGEEIVKLEVDMPQEEKIVKLTLPLNISLQENKRYEWGLKLICSEKDNTANPEIIGSIKRSPLTPEAIKKLEQAENLLEEAQIYAQFNFWNETLETMIQLRETKQQEWQELLDSIGITKKEIQEASVVIVEGKEETK